MIWLGIMLTFLLLLPCQVNAATFFVDAATGDDTRQGLTAATAWRTLTRASNATLAPGDTVLLRGTFIGQKIEPHVSGTSTALITFASFPGETAVIDGGLAERGVVLAGRSFIAIQRLKIQNVTGSWPHGILITGGGDNLIEGNEILNVSQDGFDTGDSVYILDSSRNRILGNTIRRGGHSLILVSSQQATTFSDDNVIRNNTLSNAWGTIIGLQWRSRRAVIELNRLTDSNVNGRNPTATTVQINSTDNIIRNNEITNNNSDGFMLAAYTFAPGIDQDAIGNQITDNTVTGNTGASFRIFEKDGRSVRNNLIARNTFTGNAGAPFGSQRYQVWIDHYATPIAWPVGNLNGNKIENNTVLRSPGTAGEQIVLRVRNDAQGGNLSYSLPQFQAAYSAVIGNRETVTQLVPQPPFGMTVQ